MLPKEHLLYIFYPHKTLCFFSMTMLVLLAATTGTRIVSSHFWSDTNWFLFYRSGVDIIIFICCVIVARSLYLRLVCSHATKICFLFASLPYLLRLTLFHWYITVT